MPPLYAGLRDISTPSPLAGLGLVEQKGRRRVSLAGQNGAKESSAAKVGSGLAG